MYNSSQTVFICWSENSRRTEFKTWAESLFCSSLSARYRLPFQHSLGEFCGAIRRDEEWTRKNLRWEREKYSRWHMLPWEYRAENAAGPPRELWLLKWNCAKVCFKLGFKCKASGTEAQVPLTCSPSGYHHFSIYMNVCHHFFTGGLLSSPVSCPDSCVAFEWSPVHCLHSLHDLDEYLCPKRERLDKKYVIQRVISL